MRPRYERRYPPTISSAAETEIAAAAAASLAGDNNVKRDMLTSMAAEDFACFFEKNPGLYLDRQWHHGGWRNAAQSAL